MSHLNPLETDTVWVISQVMHEGQKLDKLKVVKTKCAMRSAFWLFVFFVDKFVSFALCTLGTYSKVLAVS